MSGRRWIGWVAWPLVVAAVLAVEFALLGDRIAADVALVLERPAQGAEPPQTAPDPPPLPAVPMAMTAAAPVRSVDLRALPGCGGGTPCRVRLQVLLDPGGADRVDWVLRAHDLCTGGGETVGAATAAVAPDGRADVVLAAALPAGPALALTATLTAPAPAAAEPVRVPATGRCTP